MTPAAVYIHGAGGDPREAEHYIPLFPERTVIGFGYHAHTPWDALEEFGPFFDRMKRTYGPTVLIANSIGAFFAMQALKDAQLERAYLISPIVDMEQLICDMMRRSCVSEGELAEKGVIPTAFGQDLSWAYLTWVRAHPISSWNVPTAILYGSRDALQSHDAMRAFAARTGATLTVMDGGEHWFHTPAQMAFLDRWISECPPTEMSP